MGAPSCMLLAPKAGPRPLLLRPRPTVAIAAALALTTLADDARADLFDMLGHDPGQAALAGSDVSFGESIGVLRSNPARLVAVPAGATLGLMAFALHRHVSYRTGYALLTISAALAFIALIVARIVFPVPSKLDRGEATATVERFTRSFWWYMVAAACFVVGNA